MNFSFNILIKLVCKLFVLFKCGVCIRVVIMIFKKFNLVLCKYVCVKLLNGMEIIVYIGGEGYNF